MGEAKNGGERKLNGWKRVNRDSTHTLTKSPEREFSIDYEKWRTLIYKTNLLCMAVVLFTEIVMYFVFRAGNLFRQSVPVYLWRFLVLPTLLNLCSLLLGRIAGWLCRDRERILNAIPLLQLTGLCFLASVVHFVFPVTFATFTFPIFLSTIFSDKRLTHSITTLSFLLMTAAQFIGPDFNDRKDELLIPEYFVALITLLATTLICTILARFQDERNRIVEASYQSRMEALQNLNLDQKTGLYGTTAFYGRLNQLIGEQTLDGDLTSCGELAMAILDIDDFKLVNDTYGHANGDEVILRLARLMLDSCGERFFPVRFGGEEFVVLFFGGQWQEYRAFTKRLVVEFAASAYDFTDRTITVSAGLALWEDGRSGEELFALADKALYGSKTSGKNRVTVYTQEIGAFPTAHQKE